MNSSFLKGLLGEQDNRLDDGGVASISPTKDQDAEDMHPHRKKAKATKSGWGKRPKYGWGVWVNILKQDHL